MRLRDDPGFGPQLARELSDGLPAAGRHEGVVERILGERGEDDAVQRAMLVALGALEPGGD